LADFERVTHFEYMPMPGGDLVTKEPWRMSVSYLYSYFGENYVRKYFNKFFPGVKSKSFEAVLFMMKKRLNCPETSSAGRLFDAVSALTGVCPVASYHAEPPMRLESVANPGCDEVYPFAFQKDIISFKPTFRGIITDLSNGMDTGLISAKFHNTIINVMMKVVSEINTKTGLKKVALSGGTFQNKILLEHAENHLQEAGYEAYSHVLVPSNDGGIALGQLAIAAKKRSIDKAEIK
jgi:hydrogenase maturation protein HypF